MEEIVREHAVEPPRPRQAAAQRRPLRSSPCAAGPLEHSLTPGESPASPPLEVDLRDRYEELDVLGSGGAGVVTLARDLETNERVAVKRLRRHTTSLVRRFRREAQTIASLEHPGIVRLLRVLEGEDSLALVLELVEGSSLEEVVRSEGRLTLSRALEIVSGVACALDYAHGQGVVHRDVKPTNILIGPDGAPKLVDFGLALPRETLQTMTSTGDGPCGTLDYMAPEQWRNADGVDGRADIYGLGATLYRILTGSSPRVIRERRIPELARELVLRCVEEHPQDRFGSMQELGEALKEVRERSLRDESGVHAPLERVTRQLQRDLEASRSSGGSRRLVVAASGLVALRVLAPGAATHLRARLQVGAPLDDELAELVETILAQVRGQGRPRVLRDAHAVLAAAVSGRVGGVGRRALKRLAEAGRQPVRQGASLRLTEVVGRLAQRGALTHDDLLALAADPGPPAQVLEAVLRCLRRQAYTSACSEEWRAHDSRWRYALRHLSAALPDVELAPLIERERVAARLEAIARKHRGA